ncbi:hypothetical protein M422DRAFT_36080 [Sphaerobolus stellatus SS14]|uniref:DUF6699 domain-containing protein n=1 Tax=Sphaerobolus stellatus (strain SS14) TaxID=990650 RepID=A0A0C9V2Q0_SPHS4|nr:hypothetical protein M422DRAFT_36080 [Sphaerobolus stellatus SS14]
MSLDVLGDKWASGQNYGPVLTRTDLLLLEPELEIHPLLAGFARENFVFNIVSGQSEMVDLATGEQLPFPQRRQFATIPRVEELVIVSRSTPWVTIIKNAGGVLVENVIAELYQCYNVPLTAEEDSAIQDRIKQQMRRQRARAHDMDPRIPEDGPFARRDLFRGQFQFDYLEVEGTYTKQRLGFVMPNVFVLHMQG